MTSTPVLLETLCNAGVALLALGHTRLQLASTEVEGERLRLAWLDLGWRVGQIVRLHPVRMLLPLATVAEWRPRWLGDAARGLLWAVHA